MFHIRIYYFFNESGDHESFLFNSVVIQYNLKKVQSTRLVFLLSFYLPKADSYAVVILDFLNLLFFIKGYISQYCHFIELVNIVGVIRLRWSSFQIFFDSKWLFKMKNNNCNRMIFNTPLDMYRVFKVN